MAKQTINIGTGPNTKTGDPLRTAFTKINQNFTELYSANISTNELVNGAHTLSLDGNGDLILPDNGGIVFDRANTTIRVGMGFHIASGEGISLDAIDQTDPDNLVYKSWYFSPTGSTYFPTLTVPINDNANPSGTGQTLNFGDTSQQAIIYGPESTSGNNSAERIIIQGAPGFTGTSGEGGDVYVWAGPGGDANGNGGDIKVRAGRGDGSGSGGYLNFQAGDSSTGNAGYINIESGQSNTYGSGGDITIWAHDGGDIKLRTHNNLTSLDWIFKADGSLQSPAGSLGILKTVQNVSTGGLPAIDIIGNVVFADANAADDHITLLLPQSPPTGAEVTVKNINSGGFSVNVLASTDDTVAIEALDGTISTTTSGILFGSCHATWIYDGATWRIIDRYTT